ncbi:MAG: ribonuclease R [Planctomycetes bacterium]|nr:ribonuclease R [Planctomycetota bacterium]
MARGKDVVREQLLGLMAKSTYMPQRKRRLAKLLEIPDDEYVDFRHLIDELVEEGAIVEPRRGKYELTDPEAVRGGTPARGEKRKDARSLPKNAIVGRIDVKRGGFGFLISEPPGRDLYIPKEELHGALDGDLVAVLPRRKPVGRQRGGGMRTSGQVIKVLERVHKLVVGTFYANPEWKGMPESGTGGYVVPDTRGLFEHIQVLPEHAKDAKDGDKVAIALMEARTTHRSGNKPTGVVEEVYGEAGEARAEIASIIQNFNLRVEFPEDALHHAERIKEEIPAAELEQRTDYTSPLTFTIDPEDAKDHDDAVALRVLDGEHTELLVHIADVSHYVTENSPIDQEARRRGTSVYLPGQVLPMLPEKLSSNMCSLKEGKLRLTKTVGIVFSKAMKVERVRIERSYIRSAAFLTYDRVKEAIDAKDPTKLPSKEIYDVLRHMKTFAAKLRDKRQRGGSIDLDLPEVRLLLNPEGGVEGMIKRESHWAHQLIEDMMLAANRAVAEYLVDFEIPGLFRVHEEPNPEALDHFSEFVREFGIHLSPPYNRATLQKALDAVVGKPYQHTVHLALLTSLKRAHYSAGCHPHFALNFNRYLHFTSPIRRYPDLIVHRALDERFKPGEAQLSEQGSRRASAESHDYYGRVSLLRGLADHCSNRERDAAAAEEEVTKVRQIEYLKSNRRDTHLGVITGVKTFGFFVELQDCYIDAMVRMEDLDDDYYVYYEEQHLLQGRKKKRSFRLGDKVTVRIVEIDVRQRRVYGKVV